MIGWASVHHIIFTSIERFVHFPSLKYMEHIVIHVLQLFLHNYNYGIHIYFNFTRKNIKLDLLMCMAQFHLI